MRALSICEGCGRGIPAVVLPDETNGNECMSSDHFSSWLERFQWRENIQIPKKIIEALTHDGICDRASIRKCLKRLGEERYYGHETKILYQITGIPPLRMTAQMEDNLREMFAKLQVVYNLYKGEQFM